LDELGHKTWDTVHLSFGEAILNYDIFSLDIAVISQPLSESL